MVVRVYGWLYVDNEPLYIVIFGSTCSISWLCVVIHELNVVIHSYVVTRGYGWLYMVIHVALPWLLAVIHGYMWLYLVAHAGYGLLRMVMSGYTYSYVVICGC